MAAEPDPLPGPAAAPPLAVELGPLVCRLSASLGDGVPPQRIEQVLRDLLEQEFSEARVTAFLPIFLHRYAAEALRQECGRPGAPARPGPGAHHGRA